MNVVGGGIGNGVSVFVYLRNGRTICQQQTFRQKLNTTKLAGDNTQGKVNIFNKLDVM